MSSPRGPGPGVRLADRLQHDWWSGRPSLLTVALKPLEALYALLSGLRRVAYRRGWLRSEAAPVPVLVVGNIVVGGAGKTPTVIAVVNALRDQGRRPGIISRGYGRQRDDVMPVDARSRPADVGDEPLLMHLRTGVPVVVGRDRVAAARALCAGHPEVDVLVSDDGLQHLRLARDAQVIVFDDRGVGNGWLLPAGPLREPLPRRLPPRSVALYNAVAPSTPLPGALAQRQLTGAIKLADWWRGSAPSMPALHALAARRVRACAGMANPERFFRMLEAEGLQLDRIPAPDHHDFATLPWDEGDADILVTEKDAVKLDPARRGTERVWVVALDLRLPDAFVAQLQRLLPARPAMP